MFFVTIISCLLPFISGKLLKNPKNIKDFEILEVCFPAMWRLKFLKNFKKGEEGREGEGKGRGTMIFEHPISSLYGKFTDSIKCRKVKVKVADTFIPHG